MMPGPPTWTIVTFGEWSTAGMWDRGYLMVLLDTQSGVGAEYYLLVRSGGQDARRDPFGERTPSARTPTSAPSRRRGPRAGARRSRSA